MVYTKHICNKLNSHILTATNSLLSACGSQVPKTVALMEILVSSTVTMSIEAVVGSLLVGNLPVDVRKCLSWI